MSDNYYRSVSGLAPAPCPECQPSQAALEQNTPEYLTSLGNIEVGSILRVMEQPEIYADSVDVSKPSTPTAPKAHSMEYLYNRGATPMNQFRRPCLQYRRKTIQL